MINLKSALIIILIIINLLIILFINRKENKYMHVLNNSYSHITELTYSFDQLNNKYFNSVLYSGLNIEKSLNEKMKENVPGLFVRIPELVCNTCMDSLFFQLTKQYSKEDLNRVTFIINNSNRYYFSQLKRLQGFNFPNIFETNPSEKFMNLDQYRIPYLFYVNRNFNTESVFMIEKDRMEDTERYLNIIKQKYLNHATLKDSFCKIAKE